MDNTTAWLFTKMEWSSTRLSRTDRVGCLELLFPVICPEINLSRPGLSMEILKIWDHLYHILLVNIPVPARNMEERTIGDGKNLGFNNTIRVVRSFYLLGSVITKVIGLIKILGPSNPCGMVPHLYESEKRMSMNM